MAAVDYFLKIDGIEGESTDAKHKGEIEVESFSWGVSQTGTLAFGGGGGAGKAQFQDFHFTSPTSKASPTLMLGCATGQHIKVATLTARKAGKEQQEFLKITLTDILVSSYQSGGSSSSDTGPADQFSLNFAKVQFSYQAQKPDGTLDAAVLAGWDLKANKKV